MSEIDKVGAAMVLDLTASMVATAEMVRALQRMVADPSSIEITWLTLVRDAGRARGMMKGMINRLEKDSDDTEARDARIVCDLAISYSEKVIGECAASCLKYLFEDGKKVVVKWPDPFSGEATMDICTEDEMNGLSAKFGESMH